MSFILIGREAHTLPYAMNVPADSVDAVVSAIADMEPEKNLLQPYILIDLATGDSKRVYRSGDGWALSDTAFEVLGLATTDDYFTENSK